MLRDVPHSSWDLPLPASLPPPAPSTCPPPPVSDSVQADKELEFAQLEFHNCLSIETEIAFFYKNVFLCELDFIILNKIRRHYILAWYLIILQNSENTSIQACLAAENCIFSLSRCSDLSFCFCEPCITSQMHLLPWTCFVLFSLHLASFLTTLKDAAFFPLLRESCPPPRADLLFGALQF